ncbi:LCP family protein [Candidatus Saccharibacteria bacterium]|nr:LCP family protein [Candidatus Saccharibacteria bacterium]
MLLPIILLFIQALTSLLFLFSLAKLNLLQTWQFILVVLIILGLFVLCVLKVSKPFGRASKSAAKKTTPKIKKSKKTATTKKSLRPIFVIISILTIVTTSFGLLYARQAIDFINQMTNQKTETQIYKVLTLKSSRYEKIEQLDRQHVGFLGTNPNLEKTQETLKSAVNYKPTLKDDLGSLLTSLDDFEVGAIVLGDSYLEFLEESDSDFLERSRVIYEFEVLVTKTDNPSAVDVTKESFILYISGSDARGPISQTARSDVNILAVVNPKQSKILLVSIPRDYYVQLHGTTGTKDKLTHAGIYGIDMSKTTLEDLLGVKVNYTLKVGFSTVIRVVDALGGIEIDSDQAFTTYADKSCKFTVGKQFVNSNCALAFARERYAYTSGDRHRGQNQQQVLTKIIEKMTDPHYLVRYPKILEATEGSFETNLSYEEITDFARTQLASLKSPNIESISLDGTGAMLPTYSMGAQRLYVMLPDTSTIESAKTKIQTYLKD